MVVRRGCSQLFPTYQQCEQVTTFKLILQRVLYCAVLVKLCPGRFQLQLVSMQVCKVTIHAMLNRHLMIVINCGGCKLAVAGKLEIKTLSVSGDLRIYPRA